MSILLEILGRAMTVDTADLIWHWFEVDKLSRQSEQSAHYQQLDKIIELMGDAETDAAEEQLRLYLFENPSCVRGRLAAAAISLRKNHLKAAIEELNSVYVRQPNHTLALYVLGHCYERLGKEAQAVEFYQDCLKFKSYLQLPRQRLAAICFKNGQLEKTIHEYEQLKTEYPDDISTLVLLGHLYIASRGFDAAVETFNTAILMHPDNLQQFDDEIDQLIRQGQPEQALQALDLQLADQPDRPDLILRRADILSTLGATEDALSEYQKALRICPELLEATIKLGTHYLKLHNQHLAAVQYNRAVEINDRIVDAYIGLAIARKSADKASESLATLSLAATIQANSAVLLAETATLQFKIAFADNLYSPDVDNSSSLIDAVIGAHRQQISNRPQNPDLYYRLGLLLTSVGRTADAITALETALQINPTYSRAKNNLAVCLFETGKHKQALDLLTGPDCLDKHTLELHYRTALLYCDKRKFQSSLSSLERQFQANLAPAETTINISIVLQNLGLVDRAVATWHNLSETTTQAVAPNEPFPRGVL